jgi:F-type H+-transporting ATPase subunit alpha
MAHLTDEIASVLREEISRYQSGIDVREVGRVLEVGDGIARVWGLSGVMAGEMVEFPGGITGLALIMLFWPLFSVLRAKWRVR